MKETSTVELLYIWINEDETGFIRQQGFNFSPEFHFEMEPHKYGSFVLTCTKNENYPNVWKTGNIVNLTAIVGENGSGKSSLLRHLASCTLRPYNPKANQNMPFTRMVQIYRINGVVQIIHNLPPSLIENKTRYQITHKIAYGYSVDKEENQTAADLLNLLTKQTKVYMSNAFTSTSSAWSFTEEKKPVFLTTSANHERATAFFRQISVQKSEEEIPESFVSLQNCITESSKYRDFDQLCAISYYHRLRTDKIETVLIESGNRSIKVGIVNPARWFREYVHFSSIKRRWEPISCMIQEYLRPNQKIYRDPFRILYDALTFEIVCLISPDQLDYKTYEQISREPLEYLRRFNVHHQVFHYYESALEEIQNFGEIIRFSNYGSVKDVHDKRNVAYSLSFEPNTQIYDDFCKYIDELMQKDTSFVLKYLIIEMPPLSSGEQALQNILSWLKLAPFYHNILNKEIISIQNNILLLLDEVDLYMHPEWQRCFLKYLSEELDRQYQGKHIQIIISTHSPLILSDIPAGNIIYLQKGDEPYCTLSHGPARKESFGANIFSLLKDSFFLEHSMGAFALEKITGMIQKLNELKQNPTDNTLRTECRELRPLIDIIGEPAVRRKLLMMYDDLFHTAPHEQDIDFLQQLLLGDSQYRSALENIIAEAKSHQEGNET